MRRKSAYAPKLHWRRRLLLGCWIVAGLVLVGRAAQLQLMEAPAWREMAAAQHRRSAEVPAPRGAILDRDGVPLAVTREVVKVQTSGREMEDPEATRELLQRTLGISARTAALAVDPEDSWHVIPGVYEPAVREALGSVRGVHLTREIRRDLPHGDLALGVLGRVLDGEGRGGIEAAFEEVLQGVPGRQVMATDRYGRAVPGQTVVVQPARPGGDVVLTLDVDLQEIAHQALAEAVESSGAEAGDLVLVDPRTGEILALVSFRDGRTDALSALNTPYEPGSTLKPFTVAALLRNGKAALGDTVDVGSGYWHINGRTIKDVHGEGRMTLAEALQESSNVGVAKAALPLTPREQYENLRDFGFGVPTGLLLGEVGGRLSRPEQWTLPSPQSLAIGYEISVTPVQMAMAYAALANGGELMEARLVREVRRGRGEVERFEPRVVRRVVDATLAYRLTEVLVGAVDDGTGTKAQLETFRVAGKSGTSRIWNPDLGDYESGEYFSSFAGFFPADDPQLVVFVKLERPEGAYYGGAVAAPVTRATMEATLAARSTPLDRRALLRSMRRPIRTEAQGDGDATPRATPSFAGLAATDAAPGGRRAAGGGGAPADGATWPDLGAAPPGARDAPAVRPPDGPRPVPDLAGQPLRSAARQLHTLGFRVLVEGTGAVRASRPAPGTRLEPGDTVRLVTGPPER
jgi:cell division protein FtsI (penicillin-binding protein 3)